MLALVASVTINSTLGFLASVEVRHLTEVVCREVLIKYSWGPLNISYLHYFKDMEGHMTGKELACA